MTSKEQKENWEIEKATLRAELKILKRKNKAELKIKKINNKATLKTKKIKIRLARKIEKIKQKVTKKQNNQKALSKKIKVAKVHHPHTHLAKIKVPTYSLSEELINSISHGVAAIAAIVAMILCLTKAETPAAIISSAIYGVFMIILYTFSCIYHALPAKLLGKKVLRIIDHINVMLMVAGTYTPICLSLIGGGLGWLLFAIVWSITIIAVVLNAINVDKYQYASVACNLILGWGALLVLPQLLTVCPLSGVLVFLVGGGAVYSIGSILYLIGAKKKYMHSVFHFFVITASVLHFFFIYLYCI